AEGGSPAGSSPGWAVWLPLWRWRVGWASWRPGGPGVGLGSSTPPPHLLSPPGAAAAPPAPPPPHPPPHHALVDRRRPCPSSPGGPGDTKSADHRPERTGGAMDRYRPSILGPIAAIAAVGALVAAA